MNPPLLLVADPPERLLAEFPRLSPLVEPGRASGPSRALDRPWAATVRSLRGVRSLIRRQEGHADRCLWVALPDPERLKEWGPELVEAGYPLGVVAPLPIGPPVPWDEIRALIFISLHRRFPSLSKREPNPDEVLIAAAKKRSILVHVRDVTSATRIRAALQLGVDSFDAGEPARRWPNEHIPRLSRALRREGLQPFLPFDAPRPARRRPAAKVATVAKQPPVHPPATSTDPFGDSYDDGPPRALVVFRVREGVPWPRKISRWVLSDPFHGALSAETYDLVARIASKWPYRLLGGDVEIDRPESAIRLDAEQALLASETGGFGLRRLT